MKSFYSLTAHPARKLRDVLPIPMICVAIMLVFLTPQALAQWSTDPNVNTAICTAASYQYGSTIVSDGAGGAIITWFDSRSGTNYDIYAQRIDRSEERRVGKECRL